MTYSEPVSNSSALDAFEQSLQIVVVEGHEKARLITASAEELRATALVDGQSLNDACIGINQRPPCCILVHEVYGELDHNCMGGTNRVAIRLPLPRGSPFREKC